MMQKRPADGYVLGLRNQRRFLMAIYRFGWVTTTDLVALLAPEDIDDVTPDTADQREYERLMALVQEASDRNLEKAELVDRIHELGDVATRIAKKLRGLEGIV